MTAVGPAGNTTGVSVAGRIRQLGSESLVYGISGTINRSISIFLVPLYTRVFTPSDYGTIALVTTFVGLMSTVIVLGMDNSSARWFYDTDEMARRRKVISSWFWVQFLAGLGAALLTLLFAPLISKLLLKSRDHAVLIRLAALLVLFGTFSKVTGNWLRYQRKAWMTTVFFTASSLVGIGVIIVFVLTWHRGVTGLFTAQVLTGLLTAIAAVVVLRSWIAPSNFSRPLTREMLQFGLPLVPAGIASWVTASSDRVILQMFRGTSEVGLYSIAASLAGGVGLATGAFQMAFSPFAYSIIHEPVSKVVYSRVFSVYAWGSCLLGTTVSLFAPFLLRVLTTPMYYPASSSVPFLVFSLLAVGASYIAALGSGIAKKSVPVALYVFIAAGVSILLNLVLVRFLGRDGAAISALTANSVALVYLFTASQKYHHIPYGFRDALACFAFAALVVGLDRFLLRSWAPVEVAARIGACLLFIPLAFWLRIVRPDHVTRAFAWLAIRLSPQAKPAE